MQCAHPDRGAGAEEWHQAAAGQSCPTGCRTAVRCRCRSGRECRAAGGHFGRHGHLHDGGQREAGAGGRRDPARAAAFFGDAGEEHRPVAPDRPGCRHSGLHPGQKHLCLPAERLCAGHRQPAGRSGRAVLRRA